MQDVICGSADTGVHVRMELRDDMNSQKTICHQILQAARYVLRFRQPKVSVVYDIVLVPSGITFSKKNIGIGMDEIRPLYVVRERPDATGEAINTIAHETLHLTAGLNRFDAQKKSDESMAYFTGACAQLSVMGTLSRSDLVTGQFAGSDVPQGAMLSSQEGSKVLEDVFADIPDERIDANSDTGKLLLQRCEMRLQKFFKEK
ncbi:hypothetical protein K6978_01810 [Xanthomonas cucurbitae]|uniref:Uncharacterized protein n=2 Tax=Xanthomonas cucurbitae TaxID=56453 RepID=A0ABY7YHY1_9XANT|nr:hypothetical protein K6981_01810 [Xanthomonas cucurbitae]WDM73508.1 hypothetical protein K6978_01810 [Xanthomonas cucurbitae]